MKHITQIHELLETSATLYPEKNAVWDKQNWYTYSDINQAANSIAGYLINAGIHRGDRVAILHENSHQYISAYFGILKAGAVAVGLNTENTSEALEYLLTNSDSRCIITQKNSAGSFYQL